MKIDRRIIIDKLIIEAREWLGTPWVHHHSKKKIGCDCIGFMFGAAKNVGITLPEIDNYSRNPHKNQLEKYLENNCLKISIKDRKIGDGLVFSFSGLVTHVAIMTDIGMIHADPFAEEVIEHQLDTLWLRHLHSCYRLKDESFPAC